MSFLTKERKNKKKKKGSDGNLGQARDNPSEFKGLNTIFVSEMTVKKPTAVQLKAGIGTFYNLYFYKLKVTYNPLLEGSAVAHR